MQRFLFTTQGDPNKSLCSSCQGGAKMSIRQKPKLRGLLPIFPGPTFNQAITQAEHGSGIFPRTKQQAGAASLYLVLPINFF